MDKKIKKMMKQTKHLEHDEKSLLKADKKRDKAVERGEKMMHEHKHKDGHHHHKGKK